VPQATAASLFGLIIVRIVPKRSRTSKAFSVLGYNSGKGDYGVVALPLFAMGSSDDPLRMNQDPATIMNHNFSFLIVIKLMLNKCCLILKVGTPNILKRAF